MSVANIGFVAMVCGLNPYYTGSYSMRSLPLESSCCDSVLILIILEVTL